jgi:DNA polymerase III subunit epsilon
VSCPIPDTICPARHVILGCIMRIAALDFETANPNRVSACAIGLAMFDGVELEETFYSLIRPPKGYGWFHDRNIQVHGLTHVDVLRSPEFPEIAPAIFGRMAAADLVIAHWASFDLSVLSRVCEHYGLTMPAFTSLCTCRVARRVWPQLGDHQLHTVCEHIGYPFKHHHAGEDAEAAGRVLLAAMTHARVASPMELLAEGVRV